MTFRPSLPAAKDSIASDEDQGSGLRPVRGQPSVWGLPAPRRGLSPLSTNLHSSLDSSASTRPSSSSSPFSSTFSSIVSPTTALENSRNGNLPFTSRSSFPSLQAGSRSGQPNTLPSASQSRAITPSSSSQPASSVATSTTVSQAGGGGSSSGGGSLRTQTFSPPLVTSPISNSFDRSAYIGRSQISATASQSSVSKIVDTQIFILLGSITEKEGKAKWEAQANTIRQLVESNGMEKFTLYFRRLVQGNSPQIFPGITRSVENAGNYPLLVQEMNKITMDPDQAQKIAVALDTTEGDVFRDFDLPTFINHFKLNSYAKTLLASALTRVNRQDLKSKAGLILSVTFNELLADLANARNDDPDVPPILIATCALKYYGSVPDAYKTDNDTTRLKFSIELRYKKQRMDLPAEILSALLALDVLEAGYPLVKDVYHEGPQVTEGAEKAKEFITKLSDGKITEQQISMALLFMILTPEWRDFDCEVFISALRTYLGNSEFSWQDVLKGLDYKNLEISKEKFLTLYNAFLPIAKEDPNFDIQALWGGQWRHYETQLSFLRAFLACNPSELDANTIPRLRRAYDPREFLEEADFLKADIETALRDTTISLDAAMAILSLLVPTSGLSAENMAFINEVLGDKAGLSLCSFAGSVADLEKSRTTGQITLLSNLMGKFLDLRIQGSRYVLFTFWKLDRQGAAVSLSQLHRESPLNLLAIYDISQEMNWTDDLLTLTNGLGFDLAALVHRRGIFNLDEWLKEKIRLREDVVPHAIANFLTVKAEDELRTSREEQARPTTLSLDMKTVYDLLAVLERTQMDRSTLKVIQRQCLQAYPRLVSYCEGITENVDVDCTQSNALPPAADTEMQQLYKQMYSGELGIDYILQYLGECKSSNDPAKVDLFACMIHGLYDEFSCFSEYPLEPLAITAVLFGGILKVRLVSDLTLRVGQDMVLDSVRDFSPDEKMFKFGLQALIHASERFSEPEWAAYCSKLVKIPGLRGTQAYNAAVQALSLNGGTIDGTNGTNGVSDRVEIRGDGEVNDLLSGEPSTRFKSINAEQTSNEQEPDEATEEKVVFFFNNVTEQNLISRIGQIEDALLEKYQQWFARSLVEGRAKVEPNNQGLYLKILECLNNKALWNEVLRETYVSLQKLLNAESTLQSANDRKHLKNLSIWLGSLTLARDKPIKHNNIAFLDLLVEGYSMQKLVLVIPFTCNVLAQGARSQLFKPPNPWVVEIIAGLMELYKEGDIKLNQKFEIEVLFREFGLNEDSIPPSMNVRGRQAYEEELGGTTLVDGLENFDELSLGGLNRGPRNPRFDAEEMTSSLPDLGSLLHFPPASGSAANQLRLRQIVQEAVRRAIAEIVAPVVERSVTIATIATTALVHKDFTTEADEDRVRDAAQQMVKQLSGSLALVTSKEPLKMSMTNYIRLAQADLPEQSFAEGSILMCVNDNLDIACSIVERQAEERSMPEIETHIENELAVRRQHIADHPNEDFLGDSYSRWSSYIPDPYKLTPGGLNSEQMAIYLEFARQSRGPTNHAQTASADSGRQLPDVLQDAFSSLPSAPTPADLNTVPHQPSQQQQRPPPTRMSPRLSNSVPEARAMGYVPYIPGMGFGNPNAANVDERVQDLMLEIKSIFQNHTNDASLSSQQREAVSELLDEVWQLIEASSDSIAMNCAENICKRLYGEPMAQQEAEVFVDLLSKLYHTYPTIRTEVTEWARGQEDDRFLMVNVTIPLLEKGIIQLRVLDTALTRLIQQRGEDVIEPLAELFDAALFIDRPLALRADFAGTMGALGGLTLDLPSSHSLRSLIGKLKAWGANGLDETQPDEAGRLREHMLRYVFTEWTRMCEFDSGPPSWTSSTAFVSQLLSRQIITSQEDTAVFLRVCLEIIIDQHDMLDSQSKEIPNKAYLPIDSLARLVVVLVKSTVELNGAVKGRSKAAYMDSLLAIIILIMNRHAVNRGERFNQRVFFRLWSSIINEWNDFARDGLTQDREILMVFASNLKALTPTHFPAFFFGWLTLIAHRVFMPSILKLANEEGGSTYAELVSTTLSYVGHFLKPGSPPSLASSLYHAILRLILILHHDFPEFLAENHFQLCNAIPPHCTQLFNLVLSAYPSSFADLPNPFVTGLKTDRLEEMKRAPRLSSEYFNLLQLQDLVEPVDSALRRNNVSTDLIAYLRDAIHSDSNDSASIDISLIHAIILFVGQSTASVGSKTSSFSPSSAAAVLLVKLSKELSSEALEQFISCIINQLRYPNTHTHFFSYLLLHYFTASDTDQKIRRTIAQAILQRMYVVKPHPWGLVVVMLELLKNPEYNFWGQSFVKDVPARVLSQIQVMAEDLMKTAEESQRWPAGHFAQAPQHL